MNHEDKCCDNDEDCDNTPNDSNQFNYFNRVPILTVSFRGFLATRFRGVRVCAFAYINDIVELFLLLVIKAKYLINIINLPPGSSFCVIFINTFSCR